MKTLGAIIKYWREARNYTQEYIAQELGISQQAYNRIEKDEVRIEPGKFFRLLQLLDLELHSRELLERQFVLLESNHSPKKSIAPEKELYERLIEALQQAISDKERLLSRLLEDINANGKFKGGGYKYRS